MQGKANMNYFKSHSAVRNKSNILITNLSDLSGKKVQDSK